LRLHSPASSVAAVADATAATPPPASAVVLAILVNPTNMHVHTRVSLTKSRW
jgi:hypothetical protein